MIVASVFKRLYPVIVALGLVGFSFSAAGALPPAQTSVARLRLDPATLNLATGGVGELDIRVENVSRLAGAEVHLTFNPTLLEIVDADPATEGVQIAHGEFLSPDFVVQNAADSTAGTIDYAIACMPLDKAVSGSGVLAHVTVRALAKGETQIEVSGALLADMEEQPIPVETASSVVVIGSPGPSPMVWALIGVIAAAIAVGIVVVFWSNLKVH